MNHIIPRLGIALLVLASACAGTPPRLTAGARGADVPRPPLVSDANQTDPAAPKPATDAPSPSL